MGNDQQTVCGLEMPQGESQSGAASADGQGSPGSTQRWRQGRKAWLKANGLVILPDGEPL